jgi:hypothetical protein
MRQGWLATSSAEHRESIQAFGGVRRGRFETGVELSHLVNGIVVDG